jgi:hypothetical protein
MPYVLTSAAALLVVALGGQPAAAEAPAYERSLVAAAELAQRAAPAPRLAAAPDAAALAVQRRRADRGPGTVFLIVGGAVAVAGILADEGLLVVGGVAVAGYGLYLNLR